jgi:hypothetical protein
LLRRQKVKRFLILYPLFVFFVTVYLSVDIFVLSKLIGFLPIKSQQICQIKSNIDRYCYSIERIRERKWKQLRSQRRVTSSVRTVQTVNMIVDTLSYNGNTYLKA